MQCVSCKMLMEVYYHVAETNATMMARIAELHSYNFILMLRGYHDYQDEKLPVWVKHVIANMKSDA